MTLAYIGYDDICFAVLIVDVIIFASVDCFIKAFYGRR